MGDCGKCGVLDLRSLLPKGKGPVAMWILSTLRLWFGVSVLLGGTMGCECYEEFRVKRTSADLKEEQAALLRDYRLCLETYQDEPQSERILCPLYPTA